MSFEKLRKRTLKHLMWLGWAGLTGLTFVGYFTPIRELVPDLVTLDVNGWAMFWTFFFTAATYVNAGWMREQVCIYMCPYARFQSAMYDKDTLVVSYDPARGEPRGSRKRRPAEETGGRNDSGLGDCIDCQLCVQVCPTGIDIRDGLQYQCIGCAHCVDACNQVMDKMNYPRGLVSYTTEHALSGGRTHWFRFRAVGYASVLGIMIVAFTIALFSRTTFEVDVIRERGELFQQTAAGEISNRYSLRVLNKTQNPQSYELELASDLPLTVGRRERLERALQTQPGELQDLPLTLLAAREAVTLPSTPVTITLCERSSNRCVSEQSSFLGPTR